MQNYMINIEVRANNSGIGNIPECLSRAFTKECSGINILVFENRGKAKVL